MDLIHVHIWRKTRGVYALYGERHLVSMHCIKFESRVFDTKASGAGLSYKHGLSKEFERRFKRVGI